MDNQLEFQKYLTDTTVFINGLNYESAGAKISIFDRGFLFGDSIYEVCYSDKGHLLFFEDHLERLQNSARLLKMQFFISIEKITEQVMATLKKSNLEQAYLRIILTRGESIIALDPNKSFSNNLVTIARPKPSYPQDFYDSGVYLALVDTIRNDIRSVDPNAKSGNYLNNVMAIEEAKAVGAYDAIMLNKDGKVTEGTTFNIWIVKNNKIITPPIESGILAGITRKKLLELIPSLGMNAIEEEITPQQLSEADEVFITSSTRKLIPVNKVNEHVYGKNSHDWPITAKLMKAYDELIKNQPQEYKYL